MGVHGLMTYLLENQQECSEIIDLIQIAKERDFIEILTDFYSFQHFALRQFWAGLCKLQQNKYLPILGGEYESQNKFFTDLICDLQKARIHLVFFVDGAKGSSKEQASQKMTTWRYRQQQDVERVEHFMNICKGQMNDDPFRNTQLLLPVLSETDMLCTLKKSGCEVMFCPSGEADSEIAQAFAKRPHAFCVLSNDTDFCIFPDCKVILEHLFDISGYLGLDLPNRDERQKPEKLTCALFSSKKLMQNLGVSLHHYFWQLSWCHFFATAASFLYYKGGEL